jgi:hypothetical protein
VIRDVIEEVEMIQLDAFRQIGLDESNIEQYLARRETEFLSFEVPDDLKNVHAQVFPELDSVKSELAAKFSAPAATRFQDRMAEAELRGIWDILAPLAMRDDREQMDIEPLIASAPTGNLNARALRDIRGRSAILFESELVNIAQSVSSYLGMIIAEDQEERIAIYVEPSQVKSRLLNSGFLREIDQLFSSLVLNGVTPPATGVIEQLMRVPEVLRVSILISKGMLSFAMAHEIAHIDNGHHWMLGGEELPNRPKPTLHMPIRPETQLYTVFDKLPKYQTDVSSLSSEVLLNFGARQCLELAADTEGFWLLYRSSCMIPAAANNPTWPLMLCLGAVMFLWIAEMVERYIRLFQFGPVLAQHPLFEQDSDVQDLLFRRHHPSPISRLHILEKSVSHIIESTLSKKVNIVEPFSRTLSAVFDTVWQHRLSAELARSDKASLADKISPRWKHAFSDVDFIKDERLKADLLAHSLRILDRHYGFFNHQG